MVSAMHETPTTFLYLIELAHNVNEHRPFLDKAPDENHNETEPP